MVKYIRRQIKNLHSVKGKTLMLKLTGKTVSGYIRLALIVILLVLEIIICAQSYSPNGSLPQFISLVVCCTALSALEAVNAFVIKKFAVKMVFYGLDSAILFAICILTGNSLLSATYCVVLTGYYLTVEKFRDRTILFGISCGLYTISFIVGWVIQNVGTSTYDSAIRIITGLFVGLLVIALDYIVVQFLLKFVRTNRELSNALKDADESRAQLEEAYEQLTRTKVYEERNRIAKDIHDNAGHSMTTVIMQTEAAKLLIDENPQEAKNRIISANIQARNALEQMRESVHLLAGRAQTRALSEEIEEIIAQTIDGTDIRARYDLSDVNVSETQYRFICNSLKELLANGLRHGLATAFYIELKQVFGNISLLVSDNGKGVDGDICEGFGLKGIREKAESLGGKCIFTSDAGEGFETEITLPVEKEEQ